MKRLLLVIPILLIMIFLGYQGLIIYDDNFRYGRMWETPAVRPLEEPINPAPDGIVAFGGKDTIFKSTPHQKIKSPLISNNPENIKLGESLYFTYCAQCHGNKLDGNGTVGQSFFPTLPDLKSRKVQTMAEGMLFKHISFGVPDGRQPPLATTIDIMDRWRIITFIQSLDIRE